MTFQTLSRAVKDSGEELLVICKKYTGYIETELPFIKPQNSGPIKANWVIFLHDLNKGLNSLQKTIQPLRTFGT